MSSILTNTSSMVALQTLRGINSNLQDVQSQISTGKKVGSAKDNAAVWAISKSMEADVKGFKAISESLSLGQSTVAVARQASESVTDLLTDIKQKIVASQEDNVDRDKIQTDIVAMREQIGAIVGAAQFNGSNLLQNIDTTAGSGTSNVLSSLDRTATGVTASDISLKKQDLSQQEQKLGSQETVTAGSTGRVSGTIVTTATNLQGSTTTAPTQAFTIVSAGVVAGAGYSINLSSGGAGLANADTTAAADSEIAYVARDGDTAVDVFNALNDALIEHLDKKGVASGELTMSFNSSTNAVTVTGSSTASNDVTVGVNSWAPSGTTIGGGLEALAKIDVRTQTGADDALDEIEGLIQTSIDAAASFGSAQGRLETQADFISGLSDALKSGIGALVDADMEEASARLQALQVQQQLGVQALSIANQAPQSILSLFR